MFRKTLTFLISTAFAQSLNTRPGASPTAPTLSAAQIADKNAAARGGLQAWRAVQTLSLRGKMGAGGNQRASLPVPIPGGRKAQSDLPGVRQRPAEEVQLPFVIDLARPHKSRVELQFKGQTAIQVYAGTNGWKLRTFLNRLEVGPYTEEEMRIASEHSELDGYLVDYVAKRTRIELDGIERVENRDTYKLKLTLKSGDLAHVWVDAQTFLEAKVEGQPRRLDGTYHPV